jgi:glycosyltransferase involved in cell wall biosynthesis
MDVELSIIMPCLNEAETIARCIEKAQRFLLENDISGEVVVGDNGSTDGSQNIARSMNARVVDVSVRGYGAAIYGAAMHARGRYCIMGDADDSYDFSQLQAFVDRLRKGADLVMGNRFAGGIRPGAMPWKNRYIGNPVLSGLGRLLFKTPIRDFHCGIRGFSREAFQTMDLHTTGMEFASEMVIKATLLKMRIEEVPTTLDKDGRSRPPHLKPWRDGWRHLRFMLLFSPNWLFLYPGMLLTLAGAIVGAILMSRPLQVGDVQFSLGTLVYCAMSIAIGFQAIWFSLLARAYAVQEGLVPRSWRMKLVEKHLTLENGLLGGLLVSALGFVLLALGLSKWAGAHFGVLDANRIVRLCIASSLAITLGFQVTLSSLLLSTLRLNMRHLPAMKPD